MKPTVHLVVVSTAIVVGGCAASIESQRISPNTWTREGNAIKGIVYYEPVLMRVTYEFTVRVDDDGKVLGTADAGKCTPFIQKEEIQVLPDFSRPVALVNHPAVLANSKFAVTLNNGLLESINSETTSVAAELLSAVAEGAGVAFAPAVIAPAGNACNAGPRLTRVTRIAVATP